MSLKDLSPNPDVVNALRGTISEPLQTISRKPGSNDQVVTVRIALEGPGMFGLTDWEDNKEWSGIFNHCILSARYATYFAEGTAQAGYSVSPQVILDGMIISHPGRRQWEEAIWYPGIAPNAEVKRAITNETLGLSLIQGKIPEEIFRLVSSLAFSEEFPVDPQVYESWEHRLSILADHRSSDRYLPLHIRMGDFIWGNFFDRERTKPEIKEQVHSSLNELFKRQKNYRLGMMGGKEVVADEAVEIIQSLGASANSARSTLRLQLENLLEDVATEAELIKVGVDPNEVNDETVPMPAWEDQLRLQYVEAARDSMKFDMDFPLTTWWGQYARKLFLS